MCKSEEEKDDGVEIRYHRFPLIRNMISTDYGEATLTL